MSSSLDRLKALSSKLEEKNKAKKSFVNSAKTEKKASQKNKRNSVELLSSEVNKNTESSSVRDENISRVKELYEKLNISEKSPDFDYIFRYKAMNLSGIGLKEDDFGEVREGKYIQIIAITYEPDKNGKKKAKNISLGYFGKAESLEEKRKNEIIEFVLRWRYEKAFQNVEHYKELIARIKRPDTLF
ncbi:MAG: hypothetical protein ABXS92_01150 [Sulfurimonas sp.]